MSIRFDDKLAAAMELCDADAEARHDLEDGFVPESLAEQWDRAIATLPSPEHADVLLIAMMNADLIEAKPVVSVPDREGSATRTCVVYAYAGLTDAGRQLAVEHGWTDTD